MGKQELPPITRTLSKRCAFVARQRHWTGFYFGRAQSNHVGPAYASKAHRGHGEAGRFQDHKTAIIELLNLLGAIPRAHATLKPCHLYVNWVPTPENWDPVYLLWIFHLYVNWVPSAEIWDPVYLFPMFHLYVKWVPTIVQFSTYK